MQRQMSWPPICEWIVDAWVYVSACNVVRADRKAGIISEDQRGNKTDSDVRRKTEEKQSVKDTPGGVFDCELGKLLILDTEE